MGSKSAKNWFDAALKLEVESLEKRYHPQTEVGELIIKQAALLQVMRSIKTR